jgi:hypothetical protein
MSAQKFTLDPDGKWLYRAGGIAALIFGFAYIVIMVLYLPMGARPSGAEAWLAALAGHTAAWQAILGLSVLTDFLLLPFALALYLALKAINRNAMLLATAFVGLFVVLDLALTWTNIAALIALSGMHAAAASEAQRAGYVVAALYPSAVLESNLIFVYNSLTLAIGILITGLVMRRGVFSRAPARVAVATGILGIVAVTSSFFSAPVSTIAIILASTLTTIWALLAGNELFRLGRQ